MSAFPAGTAALARSIADALDADVAGIVTGYGLSDMMSEALGGWFAVGAADGDWALLFPVHVKEQGEVNLGDANEVVWREWPTRENYVSRDDGLVACKIYAHIRAQQLWNRIMASTYDFAEPGFILIDRVNEMNNNWWCENIRATNPCGEQPLPPYGSCLLGSVNLTRFVKAPFTDQASFDWDEYREVVRTFTRTR